MKISGIPHIEQYLGKWAIDEEALRGLITYAQNMDLAEHVAAFQKADRPKRGSYDVREDGIAVVKLSGAMTKYGSSLSDMADGTIGIKKAMHDAVRDHSVKAILLTVDSPGGAISGTDSLAAKIGTAAKQKPLCVLVEDMACSAAFWAISQAPHIIANPTAYLANIGIYTVIHDYSAVYKAEGIKTHVIKTGAYKGIGVEGTELTADQIAAIQADLDALHEIFVDRIASGRGLSLEAVHEIADGRVLLAAEAKQLGLIDGIGEFADAIAYLTTQIAGNRTTKGKTRMSDNENVAVNAPATELKAEILQTTTAASFKELKAALPNASADFLCEQLAKDATEAQATAAYMAYLETANAKLAEENEALAKAPGETGNEPLGGNSKAEETSDPIANWNSLIAEAMEKHGGKRAATRAVIKENPEAHEAFLAAINAR